LGYSAEPEPKKAHDILSIPAAYRLGGISPQSYKKSCKNHAFSQ